ncbi:four-carbon acid sugar kinase family protein [uncultured Mobiluncus sp.]|uniref:four-carbon acid sugar kinase family protein n=1 Tax=uncultured Mobiluncus sp. TaxID=293425 RepID=UPI0025E23428|nr:four-carbon acid sugar kinase family protein [uncultured Mobiluncus sp.]
MAKPSDTPAALVSLEELTKDWPAPLAVTAAQVRQANQPGPFFVILDDDPTGSQSICDLPVLMKWDETDFLWALGTAAPAVYVVTNTRSLDSDSARRINQEIVAAATRAGARLGREVAFISRSDSTLRGHFPLEPNTIGSELEKRGQTVDGVIIVPAFPEAGRVTVGGVHYAGSLSQGFIPVGQSEFAKDVTFGYKQSDLAQWVEEKSAGQYRAEAVIRIDLQDLRQRDAGDEALRKLLSASNRQPLICDALTEVDLRLLALAVIRAEAQGKRFIYRTGPSFVRARLGQDIPRPLQAPDIALTRIPDSSSGRNSVPGGLIVVGSHVGLTTRQLARLESRIPLKQVEIEVAAVISQDQPDVLIQQVVSEVCRALESGSVVVYTSRNLVKGQDQADSLRIARLVSQAVVRVVQGVIARVKPQFVVAKGGITSSDVAEKGLEIRRAWVRGPMLEGLVSLWSAPDGLGAGIPYVVFPGNVGDEDSLRQVVEKLTV